MFAALLCPWERRVASANPGRGRNPQLGLVPPRSETGKQDEGFSSFLEILCYSGDATKTVMISTRAVACALGAPSYSPVIGFGFVPKIDSHSRDVPWFHELEDELALLAEITLCFLCPGYIGGVAHIFILRGWELLGRI